VVWGLPGRFIHRSAWTRRFTRNAALLFGNLKLATVQMFVAKDVGDLSQVHDFTRRAAGAELNVAIGLARLEFRVGCYTI
jgi:sugar/nucleoside kinase (ribokinase family)